MNTDPNDLLTEWEGGVGNIWWKAFGLTTGKQRFVHQDQEPYIFPSSLTSSQLVTIILCLIWLKNYENILVNTQVKMNNFWMFSSLYKHAIGASWYLYAAKQVQNELTQKSYSVHEMKSSGLFYD